MTTWKSSDFDWVGGTELMQLGLVEHVLPHVPELADWNFIIAPGPINIEDHGRNIAWVHLGEREGDLSWLRDPRVAAVVFVSHYQFHRFNEMYGIADKSRVIKNAVVPIEPNKFGKTKLVFHPEPYRGLDVLLEALAGIDDDLELHVLGDMNSQTIPWADEFKERILELSSADPRVIHHGRVHHQEARRIVGEAHAFVYPSTWRETSCLCLIEALSAGCRSATNNLTVLPETGLGLTRVYEYRNDHQLHVQETRNALAATLNDLRTFDYRLQKQLADQAYSWDSRVDDWARITQTL